RVVQGSPGCSIRSSSISTILGSQLCEIENGEFSMVQNSRGVKVSGANQIAYGRTSGSITPSTANTKIRLTMNTGQIQAAGTITGSASFTDFAEYFENAEIGVIPLGTLVALEGSKVRPAGPLDDIIG